MNKKILTMFITFILFTSHLLAIENITVTNSTLVPTFNKSTKIYNVFVNKDTQIVSINAAKDENEIVTGSGSVSLKMGLNTFVVTSFIDKDKKEEYTLNITRGDNKFLEDDAYLKKLNIENYDIDFDKGIYYYEINAKEETDRLFITYETENPLAKVSLSGDIILKNKENIIKLEVVSANKKNTVVYTLKINKDIDKTFYTNHTKQELSDFDLKIIRIIIIFVLAILILLLFYITIIKRPNKDLYIKRSILHK